jgi:hypothetical protein
MHKGTGTFMTAWFMEAERGGVGYVKQEGNLLGSGLKCVPQRFICQRLGLQAMTLLGGFGTFKRWGLRGGSCVIGGGGHWALLAPFVRSLVGSLSLSLSLPAGHHQGAVFLQDMLLPPWYLLPSQAQTSRLSDHELQPLSL